MCLLDRFFFWVRRLCTKDGYNSRGPSTNVSLLQETCFPTWEGWYIVSVVSDDTVHGRHAAAVAPVNNEIEFTRWWQLKYFFVFIPIWGRFPLWLIFFRWVETTNQNNTMLQGFSYIPSWWSPEMFQTFRKRGFETFETMKGATNFQVPVFGHVFLVQLSSNNSGE